VLITFEGGEGSGKTTQVAILARHLVACGADVVQTREPGGTTIGEAIRAVLFDERHRQMDPRAELFLYLASRAQHVEEKVRPALAAGKIVLCDRFTDATLVYQGWGRKLSPDAILPLLDFAAAGVLPDATFLLDLDAVVGLARLSKRGEINRFDREAVAFHETIRQGYLTLARRQPERIRVIRADADIDTVSKEIRAYADSLIRRRSLADTSTPIRKPL